MPSQVLTITKKRKGNAQPVIRGDERHGMSQVFQRDGPSDKTGPTHIGYYSNETQQKLATQPQEPLPPTLPPSFSSLHPSPHPSWCVVQLLPDILTRPPDGPPAYDAVTFAS